MSGPVPVPAERRIFVGSGFVTGDVSELLFEWLRRFLEQHPQALALLEFTSPGPARRQVDCALIGPGGIDLIEVKNKRGVVRGSAEGEWTVEDHTGTVVFSNRKGSRTENPYGQARHTADDLKAGLQRLTRCEVKVTPLVLIPAPAPLSVVEPRHYNVALALGMGELARALRSATWASGSGWNGVQMQALPKTLGLRPFDLTFVQGRVVSRATRSGVPNVTVQTGGGGESVSVDTDLNGRYAFSVTAGQRLQLELVVPERYAVPDLQVLSTSSRYVQVPDLTLEERYSREELEEAYRAQQDALQAQFLQRFAQLDEAHLSEQAQLGLFIDTLSGELQRARAELTRMAQNHLTDPAGRALVSPGQRELRRIDLLQAAQQAQVEQVLESLSAGDTDARREAVDAGTRLLSRMALAAKHALPTSSPAAGVAALAALDRMPVQLESESWDGMALDAEIIDVESIPVAYDRSTPTGRFAGTRSLKALWWSIGVAGTVLLGSGVMTWQRTNMATTASPTGRPALRPSSGPIPAESGPAAVETATLPGVPSDLPAVATPTPAPQPGRSALPGTPVLP